MKIHRKWLIIGIIILFCTGFYVLFLLLPGSKGIHVTSAIQTMNNVRKIGLALREFKSERGSYPDRLSELLPNFVTMKDIAIFYGDENQGMCSKPSRWDKDTKLIDTNGEFLYFGKAPLSGNILMSTKIECCSVGILLYTDYRAESISIEKLRELLQR